MPGYREITVPGEARRPRRTAAAARSRVPSGDWRAVLGGALTGTLALCRQSPGTVFGSLAALGAAGFICLNALGHQAGRHPAPILPKVASAAPSSQKAVPPKPAPQADAAIPKDAAKPEAKAALAPAMAPRPARDPIGELIRSDETTASVTPRAAKAVEAATADPPVMQAQRALSRLGYGPIKPDGLMGPGTRAAIEAFERKAKLPVTGEAAGRTLRALVSKARQG